MRQIALDTETTGLSTELGHRIIEIGCIEIIDRRITGNQFHCYIDPCREIEPGAFAVHGISNAFLQDKPKFYDIFQEMIEFVKGAELIIHNAPFDVGFLNYELSLLGHTQNIVDHCHVIDTLMMARQLHPGQKNNLDALCRRYDIDNSHRELHGALLDADLLARIYLAMTGGQGTLFNEGQSLDHQDQAEVMASLARNKPIPVMTLSDQENDAHLAFLEMLKQSGGTHLWDDES